MLVKLGLIGLTLLVLIIIPYLVGMIPTFQFLAALPSYIRGLIYLLTSSIIMIVFISYNDNINNNNNINLN